MRGTDRSLARTRSHFLRKSFILCFKLFSGAHFMVLEMRSTANEPKTSPIILYVLRLRRIGNVLFWKKGAGEMLIILPRAFK